MLARSVLFVPAGRPELLPKLPGIAPDVAVIDLEDAVPPDAKADARDAALAALDGLAPGPTLFVRINPVGSPWWRHDAALAAHAAVSGRVVVPKLERPEQVAALKRRLREVGVPRPRLVAGIETALGVLDVRRLLRPPVVAAYFGAEDLVADVGGERTEEGTEVLYARSRVAIAARCHGVAALDQAVLALDDGPAFAADARAGARLGYGGKLCIHPRQVNWAHQAFAPAAADVDRSRRLLAAYDDAVADGRGAIAFEGMMVDQPIADHARRMLAAAEGR